VAEANNTARLVNAAAVKDETRSVIEPLLSFETREAIADFPRTGRRH
jgi:hypothetical protein